MRALLSVYDKTGVVELAEGLADLGWELVSSGGTATASPTPASPSPRWPTSPASPEMLGGRVEDPAPEDPRRDPGRPVEPRAPGRPGGPRHRAHRPRRGQPLPVHQPSPSIELIDIGGPTMVRAAAKNHAHVGVVVDPADYGDVLDELRADGALSRRHPPAAGPGRLRPHRGLRRRHRRLVRRATSRAADDPLPADAAPRRSSGPRSCATARTPTRSAPATGCAGEPQLVGRRRPARRQGAVVPQPLRHRGGLAAGPRARRPARRRWSSSTPTRAASPWPTTSPPPTSGPTSATRCRPSAASWPSTGRCPSRLAEALAPVFTEVVVAPAYEDGALEVLHGQEEPAGARGAAARPRRRSTLRSIDGGLLVQTADAVTVDRVDVAAWSPRRRPPTSSGATSSWPGASSARVTLERHRAGEGRPGRRHRLPASRTGATPAASPAEKADGRAAGRRLRQRRLLPLPRRPRRRRRGRRRRGHPARRLDPRRRGHRRRRRARPRHGLHRRAPLPPLMTADRSLDGDRRVGRPRSERRTLAAATSSAGWPDVAGVTPGLGTILVGDDGPSATLRGHEAPGLRRAGHRLVRRAPAGRRRPRTRSLAVDRPVQRRRRGRRLPRASTRSRRASTTRPRLLRGRPGQGRRRPAPGEPRAAGHGQPTARCRARPHGIQRLLVALRRARSRAATW